VGKGAINFAPSVWNGVASLLNAQSATTPGMELNLPMAPTVPINNLGEAVGAGVATLRIVAASGVTTSGAAAESRAAAIHSQLDPIAQEMRTTAVATTADGSRLVATSSRTIPTPAQRAVMKPGETIARGAASDHAETKIVNSAAAGSIRNIAVTRPPCDACRRMLQFKNIPVKVVKKP
jgi:hypothetical protein